MIYAFVSQTRTLADLVAKAVEHQRPHYLNSIGDSGEYAILFVVMEQTTKEVYDYFDIDQKYDKYKDDIVFFRVTEYHGYASKYLWEWMKVHRT